MLNREAAVMRYTLFVDESGQSGIKKIRNPSQGGASRYMTLGGVLVPNSRIPELRIDLQEIATEFSKLDLHCAKLNHNQTCRFAKHMSEKQILLFGVISMKETLRGYTEEIKGSDKRYYNKCAQYILERLALFIDSKGLCGSDVDICFEEGNFDYSALRSLVHKCRQNPIHPNTKLLKHIKPEAIVSKTKGDEPVLQIADLVAHALFRCVDDGPSTYGIKETRYLDEMRRRFFSEEVSGRVIGFGIYPVHKIPDIRADPEVETFLLHLTAK